MSVYRLRCYRRDVATYPTYRIARRAAERHIRDCPQGPMPWARRIRWHAATETPGWWGAAARGEWLDHTIAEAGA